MNISAVFWNANRVVCVTQIRDLLLEAKNSVGTASEPFFIFSWMGWVWVRCDAVEEDCLEDGSGVVEIGGMDLGSNAISFFSLQVGGYRDACSSDRMCIHPLAPVYVNF